MSDKPKISISLLWYDYAIIVFMLSVSVLIGIYFGWFQKQKQSITKYLHGGKNMTWSQIGLSVAASHVSNVILVLVPGEIYRYGASLLWIIPALFINALIGIYLILPTLFDLKVTSFLEYIEKRFDSRTKYAALLFYVFQQIFLFAYVSYTSAIVLATGMGIDAYLANILLSAICIFYAAIGGLKTVIWSDIFQFSIVLTCYVAIVTAGLHATGGLKSVFISARKGHRLDVDFDPDPTKRDSFWIIMFGFGSQNLFHKLVDQTAFQKLLAVPNYQACIRSVLYSAVIVSLMYLLVVLIGLIMYAKYQLCDPLTSETNLKFDQMVSYFVIELGNNVPGLSGLFVVGVLSAGLSSMSSMINASSGVIYKDLVCNLSNKPITEKTGQTIIKLIVVVLGVISILLSYLFKHANGIFAIGMGICSLINGPLLGLVLLGLLSSKASLKYNNLFFLLPQSKSSFYGSIGSFLVVGFILFNSIHVQNQALYTPPAKPLSTAGCQTNFSINSTSAVHNHDVPGIFKISFHYTTTMGLVLTGILALLISSTCCKNSETVDSKLLFRGCGKKHENSKYTSVEAALDCLE